MFGKKRSIIEPFRRRSATRFAHNMTCQSRCPNGWPACCASLTNWIIGTARMPHLEQSIAVPMFRNDPALRYPVDATFAVVIDGSK